MGASIALMLVRGNDVCLNSLLTKYLAGFQAMNASCSATFDSGVSVTWFWSRNLALEFLPAPSPSSSTRRGKFHPRMRAIRVSKVVAPRPGKIGKFFFLLSLRNMKKYRSLAFLQQSPHFLVNRTYSVGLLKLKTEGWEQHAEILSKAVGTGTSFYEVPISYPGRTYDEGKKIRAHHAVSVIWTIIRMRLFR